MFEPALTDLLGDFRPSRPSGSLLKWIGNKYRMAEEITSYFPADGGTYFDVFLGSGSILATVAPRRGVGSDSFGPLIDIWKTVQAEPDQVKTWYADRWRFVESGDKRRTYEEIKAAYNNNPNAADFLFLVRSCYGGVVRFRKKDGYMSTPVGVHRPIAPDAFARRVDEWHARIQGTEFLHADYAMVMQMAAAGDMVYCDPPYSDTQPILYGAQDFQLSDLFEAIRDCKMRGARVALSIDGTKKSGDQVCDIDIPPGLFEHEVVIDTGRSMLRRFQMTGRSLESEVVADRLMLTY